MNTIKSIDPGEPCSLQIEFRRPISFGGYEYYDPDTATITVYDPMDNVKVDGESLMKSDVGKYTYEVDTEEDWLPGRYECKVESSKDGTSTTTWNRRCFFVNLGD